MKPIDYLTQEQEENPCKHYIKEYLSCGYGEYYIWNGVISCGINKKFTKGYSPCTKEDWAGCPLNRSRNNPHYVPLYCSECGKQYGEVDITHCRFPESPCCEDCLPEPPIFD